MPEIICYITNHGTKEKPVTSKEISANLHTSDFAVRKAVNKARSEGMPICSCDKGYYYSEDKAEIIRTIQSLMHRTIAVEKAINGLLTVLWEKVENVNESASNGQLE